MERDRVTWEFLRETRSYLRHLERVALGTSYPEVVRIVCERWQMWSGLGRARWWWMLRAWALRWWTFCARLADVLGWWR